MNTRTTNLFALLLALSLPGLAFAQSGNQVAGVGTNARTFQLVVTSTGGAECVRSGDASSPCALFPAGTGVGHLPKVTVLSVEGGPVSCCWVGDTSVGMVRTQITDPLSNAGSEYGSGPGACEVLEVTGATAHWKADRRSFRSAAAPGTRQGLGPNHAPAGQGGAGDELRAPCNPGDTLDAAYGGGTCVASPNETQAQTAGSFLLCAGDGRITIRKQTIPRMVTGQ